MFQQMAERAENLGIQLKADPRGGFCARAGRTQVIGLYGASNWRKLRLEKDGQLAFLEEELREKQGEEPEEKLEEKPEEKPFLRLILCHAPLLDHNPQRRKGQSQPYLGGDRALQKMLDGQENFLYSSRAYPSVPKPVSGIRGDSAGKPDLCQCGEYLSLRDERGGAADS